MNAPRELLGRYAIVAWRRRWPALAVAWAICLAGWVVVVTMPNQYLSSARLYVDTGAVLTPLLKGLAIDSATASDLDILQRTLLSRSNLEKLISKTDLELRASTREEREALLQSLTTAIRIQPQTRNLFTIDYTDRNPKLARDVVQTIVSLFVESATGTSRDDMEGARRFLERQIDAYETKLRSAEQARAAFQVRFADLLPGASGGGSRLDTARDQAEALKGQVVDAMARRDLLKAEMATTSPLLATETGGMVASGGGGGGGSSPLHEAERNLQQLRLRYTDKHPDVLAAQSMVATLRASGGGGSGGGPAVVAARPHSVPNPVFEQLKVRLIDAESALASLQRQAAGAAQDEARLAEIARGAPRVLADYTNLNRDYDVVRKNYDELLARRESMRIGAAADEEADKVKLRIVDPPQIPTVAVGPKRMLFTAGVLVAGLGGGLGLVFLLVQLDASFYSVGGLRAIGLPVLGGVSLADRRVSRWRTAGTLSFVLAAILLLVVFGGFETYPLWWWRVA